MIGTRDNIAPNPGRALMVAVLAVLVAALLAVGIVGWRYVMMPQSGSAAPLPGLAVVASAAPPHFLFSINGVNRPLGVAVSPSGDRIYVTESDGDRETKVFDRDGRLIGSLIPPGSERGSRVPVYAAVGPEGRVYVSDRQAGSVFVYSPAGEYQGEVEAPGGSAGTWAPLALGFDAQGDLLATNVSSGSHGVVVLKPDGTLLRRFGNEGTGVGEYNYPNGIASDRLGRLVVADSNNGRVVMLDSEGRPLWSFGRNGGGTSLGLPRGLAVDDRGRAYVADAVNHNVLVFELGEREAKLLFSLGEQGIKDGEFSFPNGLAWDSSSDRLFVTDRENNRVQVWTY